MKYCSILHGRVFVMKVEFNEILITWACQHDGNYLPSYMSLVTRKPVFGRPGAGCSKLTTSLVNVSLKFKTLILQIHCYFLLKNVRIFCSAKDSHIFPTKNNSVFDNLAGIYLTS